MKINKAWHQAHPMPPHPTLQQRISWHLSHAQHCACRPVPDNLMRIIVKEQAKKHSSTHK